MKHKSDLTDMEPAGLEALLWLGILLGAAFGINHLLERQAAKQRSRKARLNSFEHEKRVAKNSSFRVVEMEYDLEEAERMFSPLIAEMDPEDFDPPFDVRGNCLNDISLPEEWNEESEESKRPGDKWVDSEIRNLKNSDIEPTYERVIEGLLSRHVQSLVDDGLDEIQIRSMYPKLFPAPRPTISYLEWSSPYEQIID